MLCKFLLSVNGVIFNLGEDCVKNWNDISYSIKRSDYTGVIRSFSSSFEFTNKAYNLLLQEYLTRYLDSIATIAVYVADNNHIFREVYTARLDFSSMKYNDTILTINSFDDTIAATLKANKSTKYEYPVGDLKESSPLLYDHLEMLSSITWIDRGELNDEGTESKLYYSSLGEGNHHPLPVIIQNTEIAVKEVLEYNDIFASNNKSTSTLPVFVSAIRGTDLHLSIDFDLRFDSKTEELTITLYKRTQSGDEVLNEVTFNSYMSYNYNYSYDGDLHLNAGEGLILSVYKFGSDYGLDYFFVSNFDFKVVYQSRDLKAVNIDLIKPVTLLNSLLYSMNGNRHGIDGIIEAGDSRLDEALLMAAESARGLENAKIYSSYNDFCKWMEAVFGYVPIISGNSVIFKHREALFSDVEPIEVGKTIDNFQVSIIDSLIYSSLRIGYEKVDYESVNGLDEFRWTNEFTTGVTMNDNKQELISPYRADAYGIQFLVNKRGEDTTDNESDKDIFFVAAKLADSSYILTREGYNISGVKFPNTMFNVMYSPQSMIEANKRFIGVGARVLRFASSDGNSDVIINGISEVAYVTIDNPLFTVAEVSFRDASTIKSEADVPIRIVRGGRTYVGYLKERKCKYGRYDGMEHTLIVKSIL